MITVWEAHRDLSEAVGDSVGLGKYTQASPPTAIPDGVVFKRTMRDTFLYRAMLSVLRNKLMTLAIYPIRGVAVMYFKLFPNTIITEPLTGTVAGNVLNQVVLGQTNRDILALISVRAEDSNGKVLPIPIKSGKDIGVLYNTGNAHSSDVMCTFVKDFGIVVYDEPNYFTSSSNVNYITTYLPYPRDPATAITQTGGAYNWTNKLDVEDSYYPEILAYARILAMADSLDYDSGQMLEKELSILTSQDTVLQQRRQ